MDYQKDLEINRHSLDQELLSQAQKMLRYNTAHAQAMYDRDRAKQALDIARANLDAAIRADLTASGAKFTEAVVDGRVRTSPTYLEAHDRYLKAEHEVQVLLGAVMAMNARRSMLENLVKLFLSGYWSEPRVEGGQDMQAQASLAATEASILRQPPTTVPPSGGEPTKAPTPIPPASSFPPFNIPGEPKRFPRPMPKIPPKAE